MKKVIYVLLAASMGLVGCATSVEKMQGASAGPTGCSPQSIEISNHQKTFNGPETWQAKCNGKKYFCTGFGYNVTCSAGQ